jgi:hypothetical protein
MTAYRYVRLGLLPADQGGRLVAGAARRPRRVPAGTPHHPGEGRAPGPVGRAARVAPDRRRRTWCLGCGRSGACRRVGARRDLPRRAVAGARADRREVGSRRDRHRHRAPGHRHRDAADRPARAALRTAWPHPGAVVLGAPEGERHGIPVAILADLLRLTAGRCPTSVPTRRRVARPHGGRRPTTWWRSACRSPTARTSPRRRGVRRRAVGGARCAAGGGGAGGRPGPPTPSSSAPTATPGRPPRWSRSSRRSGPRRDHRRPRRPDRRGLTPPAPDGA